MSFAATLTPSLSMARKLNVSAPVAMADSPWFCFTAGQLSSWGIPS